MHYSQRPSVEFACAVESEQAGDCWERQHGLEKGFKERKRSSI